MNALHQIEHLVQAAGGLLHRRDLVTAGARDRHLTAAVRRGLVRRPRRGWYSTWAADDPRFVAVAVGGRLTGWSALAPLRPWRRGPAPDSAPVIVSVPRTAARLRHRPGVRVVYDGPRVQARGSNWSVDRRDAFARALLEAPFEEAVALLDWAMYSGALTRGELLEAVRALPADARPVLDWADPRCDSYPESIARTRLRRAGHEVRPQLPLPTGERVDLVVDDLIALEVDGRAFHLERFERDRRKDLTIASVGLIPLRVSALMVESVWTRILEAVRHADERVRGLVRGRARAERSPWSRAVLDVGGQRRRWRVRRGSRSPAPTW